MVIKHLLVKEQEGFNFKLILMSATFNIELFANYFSRSAIAEIEKVMVYVGVEEKMKRAEEERKEKLAQIWGPCKSEKEWNQQQDATMQDEDDEWVESTAMVQKNALPVERRDDPAEVIEINARCFKVEEMYLEGVVDNMLADPDIPKTH